MTSSGAFALDFVGGFALSWPSSGAFPVTQNFVGRVALGVPCSALDLVLAFGLASSRGFRDALQFLGHVAEPEGLLPVFWT